MKKKLPITKNKDVVVSWVYTWSKQQDMSIHEQRIVLRILEACQAELKGVKLKDYAGTKRKFEHGLWDVDAQMHVSDVIFSGRDYNEIIAALDSLAGRFFTYEDDEEWWKCGFISNPKYKKHTGIITFRVSNDLWGVFTKFAKGYREFELNKALALPTGYSLRFYMLMSGQVYPLDISLDNLKERLGIPADKYKDKNGKDRIDNFEERVLKPAKAALDESCPYTFNYVKVRENPNNKRSKVTQTFHTFFDFLYSYAHCFSHFFLTFCIVGNELMQRRIEQTNINRTSIHSLKDAFEVGFLIRKQFG